MVPLDPFEGALALTIENLVRQHHTIYPWLPPQGIYFEALAHRAFSLCGVPGVQIAQTSPNQVNGGAGCDPSAACHGRSKRGRYSKGPKEYWRRHNRDRRRRAVPCALRWRRWQVPDPEPSSVRVQDHEDLGPEAQLSGITRILLTSERQASSSGVGARDAPPSISGRRSVPYGLSQCSRRL